MHPAILSNCFIDFYSEWPEAALLAVANTFFKHNQLDKIIANTKSVATSSVGVEPKKGLTFIIIISLLVYASSSGSLKSEFVP